MDQDRPPGPSKARRYELSRYFIPTGITGSVSSEFTDYVRDHVKIPLLVARIAADTTIMGEDEGDMIRRLSEVIGGSHRPFYLDDAVEDVPRNEIVYGVICAVIVRHLESATCALDDSKRQSIKAKILRQLATKNFEVSLRYYEAMNGPLPPVPGPKDLGSQYPTATSTPTTTTQLRLLSRLVDRFL
jgi:hypothetical protein